MPTEPETEEVVPDTDEGRNKDMKRQYKKPEVTVVEFKVPIGDQTLLSVTKVNSDYTAFTPMDDGAEQYASYGTDFAQSSSWEN